MFMYNRALRIGSAIKHEALHTTRLPLAHFKHGFDPFVCATSIHLGSCQFGSTTCSILTKETASPQKSKPVGLRLDWTGPDSSISAAQLLRSYGKTRQTSIANFWRKNGQQSMCERLKSLRRLHLVHRLHLLKIKPSKFNPTDVVLTIHVLTNFLHSGRAVE